MSDHNVIVADDELARLGELYRPRAAINSVPQIKAILVAIDFSAASFRALEYAIRFAARFDATIHLVHVRPWNEAGAIEKASNRVLTYVGGIDFLKERLADIEQKFGTEFAPDHCHIFAGAPHKEICKLAARIDADLIVLATRGQTGIRRIMLGSTAERVLRFAPCPVLIAREGRKAQRGSTARLAIGKILVPVDFSDCSLAGVKYGAFLASRLGATLRLIHVIPVYPEAFGIRADSPLLLAKGETAVQQMEELRGRRFLRGIAPETEIRVGAVIDELCRETTRVDIDLAVLSTHGRTGFRHAVLGSVTEQVTRYAQCPVLSVPSRFVCESTFPLFPAAEHSCDIWGHPLGEVLPRLK